MDDQDLSELVDLLSRRVDLLRPLGEGTVTKQELVEGQSASRSTVDRAVRDLESWGLLVRERGTIRLTLVGRLILDAYESLLTDIESVCDAQRVLDALPHDAPFVLDVVRGATVVSGAQHTPHRPASVLGDFVRNADHLLGCVAVVLPTQVELYRDHIVDHGCQMELVFTDAVLDTLVQEHGNSFEEVLSQDNFRAHVASSPLPYSLLLRQRNGSHEVCVAAHDDHGVTGIVRNDTPEAVTWACDTFRSIRYAADRITAD